MANWVEFSVKAEKKEDLDRNEALSMDLEPETVFGPMMVDLEKISGYGPVLSEDGEPSSQFSELLMDSGYWVMVNLPYPELKRFVSKPKTKIKKDE